MKKEEIIGVVLFLITVGIWINSNWEEAFGFVFLSSLVYVYFNRSKVSNDGSDTIATNTSLQNNYHQLDIKDILAQPADVESSYGAYNDRFNFEIVGESNYQNTLTSLVPKEYRNYKNFKTYYIASIELEDKNEFDKNAVAVKIQNKTVGYFPREEAKEWRKYMNRKRDHREKWTVRAALYGGAGKSTGVWLDINPEEEWE